MILQHILCTIIIFLLKDNFTKADKNIDANLENELNQYDQLLKFLRGKLNAVNNLRGFQEFPEAANGYWDLNFFDKNMNFQVLRNIIDTLNAEQRNELRENGEQIKGLLNVVELQRRDIDLLYTLIDALKENKAVLLINCNKDEHALNLNDKIIDLKNNVLFLQNNRKFIEDWLNKKGKKELFKADELNGLRQNLENINKELNKLNCGYEKHQLGDIFNVGELINKGIKDALIKDDKFKISNLVDQAQKQLVDSGKDFIGDIGNLVEQNQEIGKKIQDIKEVINNADIKNIVNENLVKQLDYLKTKLSSHEAVINNLKYIFLNEVKDTLLKQLYQMYVDYRRKKAIQRGEPIPHFPVNPSLNDLKKGILEYGVRTLFKKLVVLFKYIKDKIFNRKKNLPVIKKKTDEINLDFQKNLNTEDLPLDFNDDVQKDDAQNDGLQNADVVEGETPITEGTAQLQGTRQGDDVYLLNNINSIIDELEFYEKQYNGFQNYEENEVNEVAEENEANEVNEVAEENEANEVNEVAEENEANEANEVAEENEANEANEAAEENEVVEENEVAEENEVVEENEVNEANEVAEENEVNEANEVAEENEVNEANEVAEENEVNEANEVAEEDEVVEENEVNEANEVAEENVADETHNIFSEREKLRRKAKKKN